MNIIKCKNCGKELEHHAKGLCMTCYKKLVWKPKLIKCDRCGRMLPMHAKGFCKSCYIFIFHLDKVKAHNYRKWHNIDLETYRKVTQKCILCGFDKIVDLHHLDENRQNNSESNFIGLCPNHHKMLHDFRYKEEMMAVLREKGHKI